MSLPMNQVGAEEGNFTSEKNNCKGGEICGDLLEDDVIHHSKAAEQVFVKAYLPVASVFGEETGLKDIFGFKVRLRVLVRVLVTKLKLSKQ